jgi:hypothetical protein
MPDTIGYIDFTNVSLNDGSILHTGVFSQTTLQIDYTTGVITIFSGGPLTFSGPNLPGINGNSASFTSFSPLISFESGNYQFEGIATDGGDITTLLLNWTGQTPTSLNFGTNVTAYDGVGSYNTYSTFVTNTITALPCFVEGTLIRTPHGDLPVEMLKVGDLVVTSSGAPRSVKWLGYREINCRAHADPRSVFPIRIAADALGPNRPSQDLYLSPGHSVCVDLVGEVFIPAGYLINGATIAQIEVDEVSYWHVELDSHDVLLANNLPAESYMAMGNRGFFEERRGLLPAIEEERERTHADFCRPVVLDGTVLAFVRQRLETQAEAIGWTRSFETDLHLLVDGEVRRPLCEADAAVFLFPASSRDVRLKSNTFIPVLLGGRDPRPLGVSLTGLMFLGGRGDARPVRLDDERLQTELHPGEAKSGAAWRWTKGELALKPDFWGGLSGCVALHVTLNNTATRRWIAPVKARAEVRSLRGAQTQLHVA